MMKLLWLYLVIINIIGFAVMYMDKEKAKKGQYRIPEATLWKVAFIGGALGTSLGMFKFHHKTKKGNFKIGFPALTILDAIIVLYVVFF